MVRGPVAIGNGTRIGFATEIKNAIIGERVTIGPQCFVADSKIENDAYLGAQVRTSNHRLDKATVKVMVDGEARRHRPGEARLPDRRPRRAWHPGDHPARPRHCTRVDLRAAHHGRKEPSGRPIPARPTTRNLLTNKDLMMTKYLYGTALLLAACASPAIAADTSFSVTGDYTDYSNGFGSLALGSAEANMDFGAMALVVEPSTGTRKFQTESFSATQVSASSIMTGWTGFRPGRRPASPATKPCSPGTS